MAFASGFDGIIGWSSKASATMLDAFGPSGKHALSDGKEVAWGEVVVEAWILVAWGMEGFALDKVVVEAWMGFVWGCAGIAWGVVIVEAWIGGMLEVAWGMEGFAWDEVVVKMGIGFLKVVEVWVIGVFEVVGCSGG